MPDTILVPGGAGFIGSHTAKLLQSKGYKPVVVDNLVRGHEWAVKWGPFIKGDLEDTEKIRDILVEHNVKAVMHFAAYAYVGESVDEPAMYYLNNVAGTLSLLKAMSEAGVGTLIFSSSCTTYGDPVSNPISEDHRQMPISPYGRSKFMVEQILEDYGAAYGLRHVNLRYFNAAGADPDGELGEVHDPETHLIPVVLDTALGRRKEVSIFGTDWDTPDGTCIRDYIHVSDLAGAHLLALEYLLDGGAPTSFNLSNGEGYSVRQVVDEARRITGASIPAAEVGRRQGDPAVLVGDSDRIRKQLGWLPQHPGLDTIVQNAWDWHREYFSRDRGSSKE